MTSAILADKIGARNEREENERVMGDKDWGTDKVAGLEKSHS